MLDVYRLTCNFISVGHSCYFYNSYLQKQKLLCWEGGRSDILLFISCFALNMKTILMFYFNDVGGTWKTFV